MPDFDANQSMSQRIHLISGGAAYDVQFKFQPDKVVVNNLTQWTNTAGNLPINTWFRGYTDAAESYQHQVVDTAAAQSWNFLNPTTNGFTGANTAGGQADAHATISGITQADPCVITHSAFTFQNNQVVRLSDLGPVGENATDRGMDELDGNRYRITVLTATTFSLQDVLTGEDIDSSSFVAYVSGGQVTLVTHANALNYPQQSPYDGTSPYPSNPFTYDPVDYKLTLGSEVIGNDGDVLLIEAYKFGELTDLGDVG
jgi:hypothetical protein